MSFLESIVGFIAPPECIACGLEGSALCQACMLAEIIPYGPVCWNCGHFSPGGRTCERCRQPGTPSYAWLATTYENLAAELLKKYKFGHLRAAADVLAEIMTSALFDFFDK